MLELGSESHILGMGKTNFQLSKANITKIAMHMYRFSYKHLPNVLNLNYIYVIQSLWALDKKNSKVSLQTVFCA